MVFRGMKVDQVRRGAGDMEARACWLLCPAGVRGEKDLWLGPGAGAPWLRDGTVSAARALPVRSPRWPGAAVSPAQGGPFP